MRLSPRLLKIAGLVPENSVVADVGTDHALLPVYLVVTGKCPRAIASDVRPGPLDAARQVVARFAAEGLVDLRLGPGLTVLRPHEADVLVLAGMGGRTITAILERSPDVCASARRLILQPMNATASLRRWLLNHGFGLAEEELVREGERIYEVLAAEAAVPGCAGRQGRDGAATTGGPAWPSEGEPARSGGMVTEAGLEVGPLLWERRHPLLREFLERKRERCRRILEQVEAGGLRADQRAAARFRDRLARFDRMLAILYAEAADPSLPGGGAAESPGAGPGSNG